MLNLSKEVSFIFFSQKYVCLVCEYFLPLSLVHGTYHQIFLNVDVVHWALLVGSPSTTKLRAANFHPEYFPKNEILFRNSNQHLELSFFQVQMFGKQRKTPGIDTEQWESFYQSWHQRLCIKVQIKVSTILSTTKPFHKVTLSL